jgi:hypothetical protein
MPRLSVLVASCTFILGLLVAPADAGPKGPEKVFAGKVILSNKRFPTYAKSASAYVSAIKKQSKRDFMEDKATGEWKIHFAAFLSKPLDDLEIMVKLYDVTGRSKSLLVTFEQFTDQRGQRTIISQFTLDRKTVGVNKNVIIELEYRGTRLAAGQFRILGEAEVYSGKVDFSEEGGEEEE